jgi:hypothetical protein
MTARERRRETAELCADMYESGNNPERGLWLIVVLMGALAIVAIVALLVVFAGGATFIPDVARDVWEDIFED